MIYYLIGANAGASFKAAAKKTERKGENKVTWAESKGFITSGKSKIKTCNLEKEM